MSDAVIHPEDNVILPTSVIKLSEIIETLRIKDVSIILFVDACYSGQIASQFIINYSDIFNEMNKNAFTHLGNLFGLVTSCASYSQIADLGVLKKL